MHVYNIPNVFEETFMSVSIILLFHLQSQWLSEDVRASMYNILYEYYVYSTTDVFIV